MPAVQLKIGSVYQVEWDKRPFRVIGLDDIEVFYDCLSDLDNSWAFSGNFRKKCYFYRTSAPLFASKSKLIHNLPLTAEEQQAFRPDLPMRACRTLEFNWNDFGATTFEAFVEQFSGSRGHAIGGIEITADQLVLIPYGNKGGLKKGTIISARNSRHFEIPELIWKSKELQEAVNPQISNGIGLYRMGFESGLPSYYIGEYLDKAGLLKQ